MFHSVGRIALLVLVSVALTEEWLWGDEGDRPASVAPGGEIDAETRLKFNFQNAPWEQVLQWLADRAGLSSSLEVVPRGTFTYIDHETEFTPDGAIDLVNSYLIIKGYTLLRHDRMLLVLDLEEEIDRKLVSELLTEIPLDQLDQRGRYEATKTRFTLRRADAKVAEEQVAALLSPLGSLVVMPEAKQIVATDTGENLRTIRGVLETLESRADAKGLQAFRLNVATAEEVLAIARPLLDIKEDGNAAEDGSIRISADPLGRTVYVTGTVEKVELVEQIVKQVEADANRTQQSDPAERHFFMSHPVGLPDPTPVLRVLQTMFVGDPTLRLEVDPTSGSIIAYARRAQHTSIQATIDEMTQRPQELTVIPLRVTNPTAVVLLVDKMFAGSAAPPVVDGTLEPRQLVVRGTSAQVEQIRGLLVDMGEPKSHRSEVGNSRLRVYSMSPDAARELMQRLEQMWPAVSDLPLRVIRSDDRSERPFIVPVPRQSESSGDQDDRVEDRPAPETRPPRRRFRDDDVSSDRPGRSPNNVHFVAMQVDREDVARNDSVTAVREESVVIRDEANQVETTHSSEGNSGRQNGPNPAVVVAETPSGLIVTSEDEGALRTIEAIVSAVDSNRSSGPRFHLFYLKHVEAETAMELLNAILSGTMADSLVSSTVSGTTVASSGQRGATTAGTVSQPPSGVPQLVADKRLNALFVRGSAMQLAMVEQLLQVIDSESGPEDVLTFPRPRFIPVYHVAAQDVADVLKELYAHRMEESVQQRTDARGGGFRFPGFFGRGRGGDDGGRGQPESSATGQLPKLTIAVDQASNSVVVAAVGPLLKEVETVVHEIDQRAETQPPETVAVVTLNKTRADEVQRVLHGLLGENVQTSSTNNRGSSSGNAAGRSGLTSGFPFGGGFGRGGSPFSRGGDAGRPPESPRGRRGGGRTGGSDSGRGATGR